MKYLLLSIGLLSACNSSLLAQSFPSFEEVIIEPEIGKVCYAVTLADVDGDKKKDIVAVSESKVLWYQNPTWKKHLIIDRQTPLDNVCIAAHDIDGDGKIDFALGAGWTKIGTIHWLQRNASLDQPWKVHMIGEEKWTHRMRWADVLSTGQPQLVVSPLNATVGDGVRLTAFSIPKDPASARWQTTLINDELNRMHNHWHFDLDQDGEVDTLTASQEGVNLIRRRKNGWQRTKLGDGIAADKPNQSGAGEVKTGKLANDMTFITSVEPMHGHSLAVYSPGIVIDQPWKRNVIADGFKRGHALWTADVDNDGDDEIIFGHSDTPETFGVIVYDWNGEKWENHVIDEGGMACEDLIVEDVNGDGRPDIIAGGRATHNVKLYVNQKK